MSKRRFGNLLRRKFSSWGNLFPVNGKNSIPETSQVKADEFIKSQLRDIFRFGGDLVVMKMEN